MADTDTIPEQSAEDIPPQADQVSAELDQVDLAEFDQAVGSILVADCGSSFTRVSLLERTQDGYSFLAHALAPTTDEPPWSDVSIGVIHAIEQVAETTGRALMTSTGSLILPEMEGDGVDLFIITCSAGEPLKVVLAALVSQVSLASLERAAASSYVDVLGVIARDYVGPPSGRRSRGTYGTDGSRAQLPSTHPRTGLVGVSASDEIKIALIRQQQPEVVWVAGGTDGGSREPVRDLVETVALACTLVDSSTKPAIVYAGNMELRSEIVKLLGEEVMLEVIDNVRPTLDLENLTTARTTFQSAYVQRKVQYLPGMGDLIGWSTAPVLPTAQALGYLALYLERLYESGKGVLCADVGSSTTTVAASFPDQLSVSEYETGDGEYQTLHVATDLGVGHSALKLLERVGTDAIARWVPFEPEPGELEELLFNKSIRPITIPQNRRQLLIEQAAAREALRLVVSQARKSWYPGLGDSLRWLTPFLEPIIVSGGIFQTPRPSQALLMVLDTIEPVGITTVLLDKYALASALGAVAVSQPLAAVQALDSDAFLALGTVIVPVGRARPGDIIMRVEVAFDQGGELEIEVKSGSIEMLPLRAGEKATLRLRPRRGISVGRVGKAVEVHGGAAGLVIDARGRPLRLPSDPDRCRQLMQQWLWDIGA